MTRPAPLSAVVVAAGLALSACSSGTPEATHAAAPPDRGPKTTLSSPEPSASASTDGPSGQSIDTAPTEGSCWVGVPPSTPVATAPVRPLPPYYRRVIPRVNFNHTLVTDSITFEANNLDMRGPLVDDRIVPSAIEVAARWRDTAEAISGRIFLLRDSLWSQQDHPYRQEGLCALMIPPSRIAAAAFHPHPVPPTAPAETDDQGWLALAASPGLVFGSFPPSERLHELATNADQDPAAARSARATIRELADQAEALLRARDRGPMP